MPRVTQPLSSGTGTRTQSFGYESRWLFQNLFQEDQPTVVLLAFRQRSGHWRSRKQSPETQSSVQGAHLGMRVDSKVERLEKPTFWGHSFGGQVRLKEERCHSRHLSGHLSSGILTPIYPSLSVKAGGRKR